MPGGDRTGPMGFGPMTGRKMGHCTGHHVPGFMNLGFGCRFGRFGRGFGRGFAWRSWRFPIAPQPSQVHKPVQVPQVQPTKEQEIQMLEDEAKAIEQEQEISKQELEEIRKRIAELKKQKSG